MDDLMCAVDALIADACSVERALGKAEMLMESFWMYGRKRRLEEAAETGRGLSNQMKWTITRCGRARRLIGEH